MDLLLQDKNKIVDVVNNLKKNKPEGGANFFDRMDEFVRDPKNIDMVYHLFDKIRQEQGTNYNLILTGKFGDWIYNLIKTGKIKVTGIVIHVSGSLRSSIKNKTFQIIGGDENRVYNKNFVLLDDSYYSGSTKKEIDKHLEKYKAKIIKTYVFYDGSFQKRSDVYAVYRYYDYHMDDILPVKKLLSVLNNIDEANIPYDMLENQIMKGQIRSIKELLKEIQLLKQKFQNAGSNKVNIKSYGYKREYEKRKIKKYKGFLNENLGEFKTFDDLVFVDIVEFKPHLGPPTLGKKAKMTFDNGYKISVLFGDKYYSNGKNTYEVAYITPEGKLSSPIGGLTKDEVTDEMIVIQEMAPRKRVVTPEDPYGEEVWDTNEAYVKQRYEQTFLVTQFWSKYVREGRKSVIILLRGREVEFHAKSKVDVYKGQICGLMPALSKKNNQILILFDTKKYGVLEVDNNFPIIVRERSLDEEVRWYNKGRLGDDEEPEFKINSKFKDVGENDVEYKGIIIRPKKHYDTWQYNIYVRNPKWKKVRNYTNFGSEEEAIQKAKNYIDVWGFRIEDTYPGNLIEEEVRWYSKGKLSDNEPMEVVENIFSVGDRAKIERVGYYWHDQVTQETNKTDVKHKGHWVKHDSNDSYRVLRIDYAHDVEGYTGEVIQFESVWPFFQITNMKKL